MATPDTQLQRPSESSRSARTRARDEQLRAALEPLEDGERPTPLKVAIVVAAATGIAVAVGTATIHDLRTHGGSIPGGIFLFSLLEALAVGMYQQRYWAVVSFEGLVAFQMLVASLALVLASTIAAAVGCTLALLLGGWLFWTLIRVMGRLQATALAAAVSAGAQVADDPPAAAHTDAGVGDSCDRVA
jgi:hypothetical protein